MPTWVFIALISWVLLFLLFKWSFKKGFKLGILRLVSFAISFSILTVAGFYLWVALEVNNIPKFTREQLASEELVASVEEELLPPIELEMPDGVQTLLVWSVGSAGLTEEEAAAIEVSDLEERGGDGLADVVLLIVRYQEKSVAISIPRDLWVEDYNAKVSEVPLGWGPGVLQAVAEEYTGIEVQNMTSINFEAFVQIIDLVGGVEMDIKYPIKDKSTGLNLSAGNQTLDGVTALKYVRTRKGEQYIDGKWRSLSGSDVDRIARQQELMQQLVAQVDPQLVAKSPNKLFNIMQENVVTTDGIDIGYILGWLTADNFETEALRGRFGTRDNKSVLLTDEDDSREQVHKILLEVYGRNFISNH